MKHIYLDNSATTRPSPASLEKMGEALSVCFGNPSSPHSEGVAAKRLLDEARGRVARALGARERDAVIFTSGGTEANNLAVFGSVFAKKRAAGDKIFISEGEHASVEKAAAALAERGFEVLRIPTAGGKLDLDFLARYADEKTALLSLMLVNNETGAVYPVAEAARIVRAAQPKAFVHCDAVQGFLKEGFTAASLTADAISVSAHKINAPKGAGALFVTAEAIRAKRITAEMLGGGQEGGLRSGTENVPAAAAFGAAAAEGAAGFAESSRHIKELRGRLCAALSGADGAAVNEAPVQAAHIISITLPGVRSETMLNYLSGEGICISAGSACSSHVKAPSRALTAYGLNADKADSTVRVSLSHENTAEEIDAFAAALAAGLARLQRKK